MAAAVAAAVLLAPAAVEGAPVAMAGTRSWSPPPPVTTTQRPAPAVSSSASGAKPKPNRTPDKQAPPAQRPDSVRLAHGGTATLVRTEVGPDGVLPIPVALDQATWWGAELDDRTGATVLAGHVNYHGRTGPFNELWRSRTGDPVTIVDHDGHALRFRVTQVITLRKNELPQRAADLFGQTGPHRLVLATCGGAWVGGDVGYASNRVVIAKPMH